MSQTSPAGAEDTRELGDRGGVVVEVLEHGDGARAPERRVGKRQSFGGADRPVRAAADSFAAREARRGEHAGHRQIAADGVDAAARGLDHRRAGAADADVEVGPATCVDLECVEDPLDEAHPPVVERVRPVPGELGVEILALRDVLLARCVDENGDVADDRVGRAASRAGE